MCKDVRQATPSNGSNASSSAEEAMPAVDSWVLEAKILSNQESRIERRASRLKIPGWAMAINARNLISKATAQFSTAEGLPWVLNTQILPLICRGEAA
jgi:hypothetical protein